MTFKANSLPCSGERNVPNTSFTGPWSRGRFCEGRYYVCDKSGNSIKNLF